MQGAYVQLHAQPRSGVRALMMPSDECRPRRGWRESCAFEAQCLPARRSLRLPHATTHAAADMPCRSSLFYCLRRLCRAMRSVHAHAFTTPLIDICTRR